jgi:hypothetical protein
MNEMSKKYNKHNQLSARAASAASLRRRRKSTTKIVPACDCCSEVLAKIG